MPLVAGTLVIMLNADQFLALLSLGSTPAHYSFELKELPLPAEHIAWIFAGIFILVGIPYIEEIVRCLRFRRGVSPS